MTDRAAITGRDLRDTLRTPASSGRGAWLGDAPTPGPSKDVQDAFCLKHARKLTGEREYGHTYTLLRTPKLKRGPETAVVSAGLYLAAPDQPVTWSFIAAELLRDTREPGLADSNGLAGAMLPDGGYLFELDPALDSAAARVQELLDAGYQPSRAPDTVDRSLTFTRAEFHAAFKARYQPRRRG